MNRAFLLLHELVHKLANLHVRGSLCIMQNACGLYKMCRAWTACLAYCCWAWPVQGFLLDFLVLEICILERIETFSHQAAYNEMMTHCRVNPCQPTQHKALTRKKE